MAGEREVVIGIRPRLDLATVIIPVEVGGTIAATPLSIPLSRVLDGRRARAEREDGAYAARLGMTLRANNVGGPCTVQEAEQIADYLLAAGGAITARLRPSPPGNPRDDTPADPAPGREPRLGTD